jgi:hypothetical protein
MRRLLTSVVAGLLAVSSSAFAQTGAPVLTGQDTQPVLSDQSRSNGQDAMAQVTDQNQDQGLFGPGGPDPLVLGLGLGLAGGLTAFIISQSNKSSNPVSP